MGSNLIKFIFINKNPYYYFEKKQALSVEKSCPGPRKRGGEINRYLKENGTGLGCLEIRIGFFQLQFFDPDIAVKDIVPFGLEFQPFRRIGNAFAPVITSIHT